MTIFIQTISLFDLPLTFEFIFFPVVSQITNPHNTKTTSPHRKKVFVHRSQKSKGISCWFSIWSVGIWHKCYFFKLIYSYFVLIIFALSLVFNPSWKKSLTSDHLNWIFLRLFGCKTSCAHFILCYNHEKNTKWECVPI